LILTLSNDNVSSAEAYTTLNVTKKKKKKKEKNLWPESASELYQLSYRHLSAKLLPTFEDRGVSHSQCGGFPTAAISGFQTPAATFSLK
jgi:hypothetical protein